MMLVRLAVLTLLGILITTAQNAENAVCEGCHDVGKNLAGTGHANVACGSCHPKHEEYPHPPGIPKAACESCHATMAAEHRNGVHGQALAQGNQGAPDCNTCHGAAHEVKVATSPAFRTAIPETCGMCHAEVAEQFNASIHGKELAQGNMASPVCSDCHGGGHNIIARGNAASPVNARNIRETCGQCHGNVMLSRRLGLPTDRLTTFDASFHGLAAAGGSQTVANCASCHGVHNILPSSDPKSTVNAKNLPQTCGSCHPGAGSRFAIGPVHLAQGSAEEPAALRWVRNFYWMVIPGTIGLMLLHNVADWIRKLRRFHRLGPMSRAAIPSEGIRMLPFERVQHGLLAVSFIVLAWSGLALKYPEAWWAQPLLWGGEELALRRNVHRVAAVVMTAVAFMHVFSLIFSRKLREHWYEMIPTMGDVRDAFTNMAYLLGLRKQKPVLPSHSYIEKAEYWAVVWGCVVMIVTGLLLWFNNWSLRFLPLSVLNIATAVHWYEAILASLAIVVWHFYSVIFDPDVYPMDTAWLVGTSPRQRESRPEREREEEPASSVGD